MSSKDYIINMQELNKASDITGSKDNLMFQNKKNNNLIPEGVNFKVSVGFENVVSALPFSVSLSSDLTDFGALSPTNPIIRTLDISVYSLSTSGYSVIASENHPLQGNPYTSGQIIPNTTCDNGECNHENAEEWTSTLTYGFGYRCDNLTGIDCDNLFSNAQGILSGSNSYKHFADISNSTSPQPVMAGVGSKNKNVRLSYKVNISGNQAQGNYTNTITFIAVPNF